MTGGMDFHDIRYHTKGVGMEVDAEDHRALPRTRRSPGVIAASRGGAGAAIDAPTRTPRLAHSVVARRGLRSRFATRALRPQSHAADGGGVDDETADRRHEPRVARARLPLDDAGLSHRYRSTGRACSTATWCSSRAAIRISRSASGRRHAWRSKTKTTPTTARPTRRPYRAIRSPCCATSPTQVRQGRHQARGRPRRWSTRRSFPTRARRAAPASSCRRSSSTTTSST